MKTSGERKAVLDVKAIVESGDKSRIIQRAKKPAKEKKSERFHYLYKAIGKNIEIMLEYRIRALEGQVSAETVEAYKRRKDHWRSRRMKILV